MKRTKIVMATLFLLIIMASMFSVLPVNADVRLNPTSTHQFNAPLGGAESYSFEYAPENPCVPPPGWSVTGGRRGLAADINRDGIVDISDSIMFANAYGSRLGDPTWNQRCDFNNDHIIDMYDAIVLSGDYGKTKKALIGDYSWQIGGSGDWYMTRNVDSSFIRALQTSPVNNFVFGFWYLPIKNMASDAGCRAEVKVFYTDPAPIESFEGVWITPKTGWIAVYINAHCGLDYIDHIQVKIHLKNICAYVDSAVLSISASSAAPTDPLGSFGMQYNIYSFAEVPGAPLPLKTVFVPSIYAQAAPSYRISWMRMEATVIPQQPDSTYGLTIPYCAQENDKGLNIDPAAQQQALDDQLFAVSLAIPIVASAALTFGLALIPEGALAGAGFAAETILRFSMGTTLGADLKFVLNQFKTVVDHPIADGGGYGNMVWKEWRYPMGPTTDPNSFVNAAGASCEMDFGVLANYDKSYSIVIKGGITFAEIRGAPGRPGYYVLGELKTIYWTQTLTIAR